MFGVNESGKDTLAPQFKKGKGEAPGRITSMNPFSGNPEAEMALHSTKDSLGRDRTFVALKRAEAKRELGAGATPSAISNLVDEKITARAVSLVEAQRRSESEVASRSAILSHRV